MLRMSGWGRHRALALCRRRRLHRSSRILHFRRGPPMLRGLRLSLHPLRRVFLVAIARALAAPAVLRLPLQWRLLMLRLLGLRWLLMLRLSLWRLLRRLMLLRPLKLRLLMLRLSLLRLLMLRLSLRRLLMLRLCLWCRLMLRLSLRWLLMRRLLLGLLMLLSLRLALMLGLPLLVSAVSLVLLFIGQGFAGPKPQQQDKEGHRVRYRFAP